MAIFYPKWFVKLAESSPIEWLLRPRKLHRSSAWKRSGGSRNIKSLSGSEKAFNVVMDGIEPPTQRFSVFCSTN